MASARNDFYERVGAMLADIEARGLSKPEHIITSPQRPELTLNDLALCRHGRCHSVCRLF